ncbi:hypothetical protein Tco_0737047 [Tanacetum coccineum]
MLKMAIPSHLSFGLFFRFFTYPCGSPLLLSTGVEDTIFDPTSFQFKMPVASHRIARDLRSRVHGLCPFIHSKLLSSASLWIPILNLSTKRIVQQGNSPKRLGKDAKGNTIVHPPVSLDEHVAVQRENKKKEGLLQGYDRFQKILSQLNQVQARPDNDDINLKFLRALPSSWSQLWCESCLLLPLILLHRRCLSSGSKLNDSNNTSLFHQFLRHFLVVDRLEMEEELDLKWQWLCYPEGNVKTVMIRHKRKRKHGTLSLKRHELDLESGEGQFPDLKKVDNSSMSTKELKIVWGESMPVPPSIMELICPPHTSLTIRGNTVTSLLDSKTIASVIKASRPRPKTSPVLISRTLTESDVEDPNSLLASPSFSSLENNYRSNSILMARPNPAGGLKASTSFCGVTLGGIKDHNFGGPRVMVDLINPHGFTLITDNDIGIVDSGCSESYDRNKEKLDDFVQSREGLSNLEVEMQNIKKLAP